MAYDILYGDRTGGEMGLARRRRDATDRGPEVKMRPGDPAMPHWVPVIGEYLVSGGVSECVVIVSQPDDPLTGWHAHFDDTVTEQHEQPQWQFASQRRR